jgi:ribosome maturation factor RimP
MAPSAQPSGAAGPVTSLLAPVVEASGLVLEDVTVTPAGKRRVVRVVVDLPEDRTGSLDLDAVADVSRAVSDALDASDVLGGTPYVLEVGTPGVDRPLTERRHWSRARTRLVEVPVDGTVLTGRVQAVADDGVELEVDGARRTVPWEQLGTGRVQVEFRRPDAADDETDDDLDDELDETDDDLPDDGHDEAEED